jgi:hypothetical protein
VTKKLVTKSYQLIRKFHIKTSFSYFDGIGVIIFVNGIELKGAADDIIYGVQF